MWRSRTGFCTTTLRPPTLNSIGKLNRGFADELTGDGNVFRRRYNIVKTFHAGNDDMARSCALNYDRSLVLRLRDISMEQLDALWQ